MEKKEPFLVTVDGTREYHIDPKNAQDLDAVAHDGGTYHILQDGTAYQVELIDSNPAERQYTLRVNGEKHIVKISDRYERLIRDLGLTNSKVQKQNTVKAPMPGMVLDILVGAGQAVQKGDALIILEAMKMENVLKAAHDGVVKSIAVSKNTAVDKGQLLLEME